MSEIKFDFKHTCIRLSLVETQLQFVVGGSFYDLFATFCGLLLSQEARLFRGVLSRTLAHGYLK